MGQIAGWLCKDDKGQQDFPVKWVATCEPQTLFCLEVHCPNGLVVFLNTFNYKGINFDRIYRFQTGQ